MEDSRTTVDFLSQNLMIYQIVENVRNFKGRSSFLNFSEIMTAFLRGNLPLDQSLAACATVFFFRSSTTNGTTQGNPFIIPLMFVTSNLPTLSPQAETVSRFHISCATAGLKKIFPFHSRQSVFVRHLLGEVFADQTLFCETARLSHLLSTNLPPPPQITMGLLFPQSLHLLQLPPPSSSTTEPIKSNDLVDNNMAAFSLQASNTKSSNPPRAPSPLSLEPSTEALAKMQKLFMIAAADPLNAKTAAVLESLLDSHPHLVSQSIPPPVMLSQVIRTNPAIFAKMILSMKFNNVKTQHVFSILLDMDFSLPFFEVCAKLRDSILPDLWQSQLIMKTLQVPPSFQSGTRMAIVYLDGIMNTSPNFFGLVNEVSNFALQASQLKEASQLYQRIQASR